MRPIRTIVVLTAILSAVSLGIAAADSNQNRDIDAAKSKAAFAVEHIFVETVNGTLPILSGTVILPANSVVPVSVTAVLDPTRIKTGEDDRDGALQAPDWFDTKQFPMWTFTSTKVTPGANGAFTVDGTITIHGVSQPERLDVTTTGDPAHPQYHAVGHLDRHSFGMSKTRLDPVVGNDITVTLDVRLK